MRVKSDCPDADMSFQRHEELRIFTSKRKGSAVSQNFHYRPRLREEDYKKVEEGSLELFLIERYLLYSSDKSGRLYSGRVNHEPYQIQEAILGDYSVEMFNLEGFTAPIEHPSSQLMAKPVNVNVYPLHKHKSLSFD